MGLNKWKRSTIFPVAPWRIWGFPGAPAKKTPANPAIYRYTFGGVMATIPSTNLLCPTWRQPIHKTESMSMDWFKGNHGFLPSNICKLSHHPIRLFIKTITSEEYWSLVHTKQGGCHIPYIIETTCSGHRLTRISLAVSTIAWTVRRLRLTALYMNDRFGSGDVQNIWRFTLPGVGCPPHGVDTN